MSFSEAKVKTYYLTAILSLVFAVVGFSYNAWRMEVSEDNNNIRTASFEVIKELAALEQLVFAAHYDQDPVNGNPRTGWIKIGLINDLSMLIGDDTLQYAEQLKTTWAQQWPHMVENEAAAVAIVSAIDAVRGRIKMRLASLE